MLVDAPADLLDLTRAQAPDWPDGDAAVAGTTVLAKVEPDGSARFSASTYDAPDVVLPPGLLAANGLIGTIIGAFVAADPDWICLHAAAVHLSDGGLTVLLGDTMAGKSTLATALAALGQRLWCDDRLPLAATGDGLALGLRPKLRLPLPGSAPQAVRDLVANRGTAQEGDMVYLDLSANGQAAFGARLPVTRLIVLDRALAHGAPDLATVPVATMVKHLVPVTFAPHLDPMARLMRLRALAEACSCETLSYGDSFAAATFLQESTAP
ncbi:MAG: hypothetical protein P1U65_00885 [Minwuia sp.]|nr:hypothetical protein [Minwuia sp.]